MEEARAVNPMKVSLRKALPPCRICGMYHRRGEGYSAPFTAAATTPGGTTALTRYVIAPDGEEIPCAAPNHALCVMDRLKGKENPVLGPYLNVRYYPDEPGGPLVEAYMFDYGTGEVVDRYTSKQWATFLALLLRLGFSDGGSTRLRMTFSEEEGALDFVSPSDLMRGLTAPPVADEPARTGSAHGFPLDAASWEYEHKGPMAKLVGATSYFHKDRLLSFQEWYPMFVDLLERDPGALKTYEELKASTKFFRKWGDDYAPWAVYHKSRDAAKSIRKRYRTTLPSTTERAVELFKSGAPHEGWFRQGWEALRAAFGDEADLMADLLAATSPKVPVDRNVEMALEVYKLYKSNENSYRETGSIRTLDNRRQKKVPGATGPGGLWKSYLPNIYRALDGQPLQGLKVWNFSRALKGDEDAVVLDTWMTKALFGVPNPDSITDRQYLFAEQMVEAVARKLGESPVDVTGEDLTNPDVSSALPGSVVQKPSFRQVQEQIWGAINPRPRSYHEEIPKTMERQKNYKFWKERKRQTDLDLKNRSDLFPGEDGRTLSPSVEVPF